MIAVSWALFIFHLEPSWLTLQEDMVGHGGTSGSVFLWTHVGICLCVAQLMHLSIIRYIRVTVYFYISIYARVFHTHALCL